MRSTEGQNNGAVQKGIAEEQQEEAVQELHSQQEQKKHHTLTEKVKEEDGKEVSDAAERQVQRFGAEEQHREVEQKGDTEEQCRRTMQRGSAESEQSIGKQKRIT